MPVILGESDYEQWLDPGVSGVDVMTLLLPGPDDVIEAVAVGLTVNSPKNTGRSALSLREWKCDGHAAVRG